MKLVALLPFMDNEELKDLAFDVVNGKQDKIKLTVIFPFLKKEDLKEIVELLIEKDQTKELYSALPFLSKETVKEIYDAVRSGKITNFKEEALVPFLDKATIKALFNELLEKEDISE